VIKMTDILNESTTDGSLESFIYTLRIGVQSGVFSDEIFKDIKRNLVGGVLGSLKGEIDSIPRPKRKQFLKYVSALIKPIEASTNMNSFINSLGIVADTKNNLIKNLGILTEKKILNKRENKSNTFYSLNYNSLYCIFEK
jgi:hypothetical protein